MCGIVGVWDQRDSGTRLDPAVFDRMVDALAHRGPDGRGVWHEDALWLGHRRLAILDPTPAGAQPMTHPAGFVVTYNGEIYNFQELRARLESAGHSFRTHCDTEVLLAGYAEWGPGVLAMLNGIFAFALWDPQRRRLWLARDRLGVKPLYYATVGGVFRFASEIGALLADPSLPRRPSREGQNAFLSFGYVPAPLTALADVVQLPPAHEMMVDAHGIHVRRYWRPSLHETEMDDAEAQEAFGALLKRAVTRQMVSDVPIGAFLSGGVDSAAVVAEMVAASPGSVRTFSVGFDEKTFDEGPAAAETARLLGSRHQQTNVSLNLPGTLDAYLAHCPEPFADSSSLAVYHLCRVAAEQVTVALSGDGADELLAGYPTYSATVLADGYRHMPHFLRRLARNLVHALPASDRRYSFKQTASRFVLGAEESAARAFASWRVHFRQADKEQVCKPEFLAGLDDPIDAYAAACESAPTGSQLKRMLYADLTYYLPNDMLVKVDRMSMAHGLEVRVPFLDHELVEFCLALPDRCLARLPFPRQNKLILRKQLRTHLPEGVTSRRKLGFNVPIEKAMRGCLWPQLREAIHAAPFKCDGPFDCARLETYAERHVKGDIEAGHALFGALVLARWWNHVLA